MWPNLVKILFCVCGSSVTAYRRTVQLAASGLHANAAHRWLNCSPQGLSVQLLELLHWHGSGAKEMNRVRGNDIHPLDFGAMPAQ